MGKKDERLSRLVEILRVRGYVSIKELSRLLGVSEMTVRRDLKVLEDRGVAQTVDGTSVYNPAHLGPLREAAGYDQHAETVRYAARKEAIGRLAASMVEQGDIVAVDTGTTTWRIAANLPIDKSLTVLCYNINILMELRRNPGVSMLFAGGHYHLETQMFTSAEGVAFIRGVRAHKAFISAAGVHPSLGLTCAAAYEVPAKKAVLQSSLRRILVTDSGKFGSVRPAHFCDLEDLNDIVTDDGLSGEWRQLLEERGIALHIAGA